MIKSTDCIINREETILKMEICIRCHNAFAQWTSENDTYVHKICQKCFAGIFPTKERE